MHIRPGMKTVFGYEDGPSKDDALEIGKILYQGDFSGESIEEVGERYPFLDSNDIIEMAIYSMLNSIADSVSTEGLYKYIEKDKSQTENPKQHKEDIYSSVLGAVEANEFKSVDILFNFLNGLGERNIFPTIYADIIGAGKKADNRYDLTLPVRIFNALLKESFDEKLTGKLEKWLHIYFPKTIFDTFDLESPPKESDLFPIDTASIEKSIDEVIQNLLEDYEKYQHSSNTYDFSYLEKVNRIVNALDFIEYLSTGEKIKKKRKVPNARYLHIYSDIYNKVTSEPDHYFNMETAIKTISQNKEKYENSAVEKSLNVLELIKDCKVTIPKKEIQNILKKYIDASHPVWNHIHDRKASNNLKGRMTALYENFGGKTDKLKTPAEIYLKEQKKQKKLEAEKRQRKLEEQEAHASTFITEEDTDTGYQRPIDRYDIGTEITFTVTNIPPSAKDGGNIYGKTDNGLTVIFKETGDFELGNTLTGTITHKKAKHLKAENIEIIPRNEVIDL